MTDVFFIAEAHPTDRSDLTFNDDGELLSASVTVVDGPFESRADAVLEIPDSAYQFVFSVPTEWIPEESEVVIDE
jgi:hypothetical protein